MSELRSLYKINGPKIFFRGATVGLKSIIPQMAIKFYSTKKYYQYTNNYLLSTALAGFTDGLFIGPPSTTIPSNPWEVMEIYRILKRKIK